MNHTGAAGAARRHGGAAAVRTRDEIIVRLQKKQTKKTNKKTERGQ